MARCPLQCYSKYVIRHSAKSVQIEGLCCVRICCDIKPFCESFDDLTLWQEYRYYCAQKEMIHALLEDTLGGRMDELVHTNSDFYIQLVMRIVAHRKLAELFFHAEAIEKCPSLDREKIWQESKRKLLNLFPISNLVNVALGLNEENYCDNRIVDARFAWVSVAEEVISLCLENRGSALRTPDFLILE